MVDLKEGIVSALSRRGVRYAIVGTSSLALAYGVFSICYKVYEVQYVYATMIANTIAWMFNFPLHKWWTFGDWNRTKKKTSLQTSLHFSLKVWNAYIAAPLFMVFLVEYAGVPPLWANPVVGIFLGVAQNYPINRFGIFRRPPE